STGGTPGTGGATSTGTGGAGGSGTFGQPVCGTTGANVAIAKSVACTSTDTQLCYKTCGPSGASGVKSETCTNSAYVEMPGCSFPPGVDYSCYKIPTTVSSMCPTTAPQANMPCTVPTCTPCNVGGNYLDSTAASKTGWCVCTTSGKWTCATTGTNSSWPCPGNTGC
ncbi:MAG TPA: hypothetical protein VHG72_03430, partial [Polyangia bacterium]|nr:hypothetical protein [Polyangia bacterium]